MQVDRRGAEVGVAELQWQAALLKAEQNRPKLRLANEEGLKVADRLEHRLGTPCAATMPLRS